MDIRDLHAYRKRNYPKHFKSKLTDSDGENSERLVWLVFAYTCQYIKNEKFKILESETREIGKLFTATDH